MSCPAHVRRDGVRRQPQKSNRKSLVSNILPITPLFLIFCAEKLRQTIDSKDWGEGGTPYTVMSQIRNPLAVL